MRINKTLNEFVTRSVFLIGLYLLAVSYIAAQEITGTILGAVTDSTGATVPGAKVTVRNVETNVERNYSTNDQGLFLFPLLPAGSYELTVEAGGFQKFIHTNIVLYVNQKLRVDVTLKLGSTNQSVTVTGAPPILETGNGSLGQTSTVRLKLE